MGTNSQYVVLLHPHFIILLVIINYSNSSSTHMFFADFEANEIALCKNLRRHHVGQVCGQILVLDAEVDEELQNAGVPPWKRLMGGKIISLSVCNILIYPSINP